MSEPRILGPTDRATIRQRWRPTDEQGVLSGDLLALLDTCDAMANVIRWFATGWWPDRISLLWFDVVGEDQEGNERPTEAMSPVEAAVLDTIREDHTDV